MPITTANMALSNDSNDPHNTLQTYDICAEPGKPMHTGVGYLFSFIYMCIVPGIWSTTWYTSWNKVMIAQLTNIYMHFKAKID